MTNRLKANLGDQRPAATAALSYADHAGYVSPAREITLPAPATRDDDFCKVDPDTQALISVGSGRSARVGSLKLIEAQCPLRQAVPRVTFTCHAENLPTAWLRAPLGSKCAALRPMKRASGRATAEVSSNQDYASLRCKFRTINATPIIVNNCLSKQSLAVCDSTPVKKPCLCLSRQSRVRPIQPCR